MATPMIDVYVKLPSGKATCSHHLPTDLVSSITHHLSKQEGVPEPRIKLKYQGKVVDKSKAIGYLGICAETILKGEILVPKNWSVYINFPDGRCEPVSVLNTDSVLTLKQKIKEVEDIPPTRQILKLDNGHVVNAGRVDATQLISDVGISNECVLTLTAKTEEPLKKDKTSSNDDETVDEDKRQELMCSFDTGGRNVDVVFCFDTTGSMYSCLDKVRRKLRESCERLLSDIPNMRIGIMAHGDYCDYGNYVVRYVDLTSDTDTLVDFAKNVPSTGGGDSPECYEWALKKAQELDWSENSAKAFIMIGDCLPHPPSYTDQKIHWMSELDVLAGMGVKVYGVQATNLSESRPFYEELAASTGGYFLQLKNFDLITDMFLAVCYREADPGQLDAFVEEVEKAGRMTEDTKAFMEKLEEDTPTRAQTEAKNSDRQQRYIRASWWDPALDSTRDPSYTYCRDTDKWKPYNRSSSSVLSGCVPTSSVTSSSTSVSMTTRKKSKVRRFFCLCGR